MNEPINHILVTLNLPEAALCKISKTLRRQVKSNRHLKVLALLGVGYVVWAEVNRKKQEEKIDRLTQVVEKPECSEGE